MHVDSTTEILFGIALIFLIIYILLNSKKFGDKVSDVILILFTFAVGSILMPLILGLAEALGEFAYYLNNNIRNNNPYLFWGSSIVIGIVITYFTYKKRSK